MHSLEQLERERNEKVYALGQAYVRLVLCSKQLCDDDEKGKAARRDATQAVNALADEVQALDYMIARLGGRERAYWQTLRGLTREATNVSTGE
jgi:hypothetical protein